MYEYISNIEYNEHSFKAKVVTTEDSDILNDAGKFLPFVIKLDEELRKTGVNKELYDVIYAHGGERCLFEGNKAFMSKEKAAQNFDVLVACNNNLWKPGKKSKLVKGGYALGLIRGTGLCLRKNSLENQIPDCVLYSGCENAEGLGVYDQNPDGKKIVVAGKPYHFLSFEGYQDPQNPVKWTDKGIEFFKINNLVDKSREVI
jgi:hypothetical protein